MKTLIQRSSKTALPASSLRFIIASILSLWATLSASANVGKDIEYITSIQVYNGKETDPQSVFTSADFQHDQAQVHNLGLSDQYKFLTFRIPSDLGAKDCALSIENPGIDELNIYKIEGDHIIALGDGGEHFAASFGGQKQSSVLFDKAIEPNGLYGVRIKSGEQLVLPILAGKKSELSSRNHDKNIIFAIYAGMMLVLLFYNFFIYLTVKDRIYLLYVGYIASVGLTQMVLNGYGSIYLWPNSYWLTMHATYIIGALSGISTIFFCRRFLEINKNFKTLDRVILGYLVLYVVAIVLAVNNQFNLSYSILNFNAASALLLIWVALKTSLRGNRAGIFFLISWTFFLGGATVFALRDFGVLGYNAFTIYALPAGSVLEGLLLSFALADKINQFKKEKELSQSKMIQVMHENQLLIEEQNLKLEELVHVRTQDLEKANANLNETLNDLKLTQNQLLESEKLASLGQMTAGIAHEINNPINFVSSNILPLKRDIQDILTVLEMFSSLKDASEYDEKIAEIRQRMQRLDIDYTKQEIAQLLSGIDEGSRRTAEIVKSLRIFSRMDRDELVSANINECINSTLVIMKSVTKGEVTVRKKLADNFPVIDCYPGKLNQVIMNIMNNAVYATKIEGKKRDERFIDIETTFDDETITIAIEDNGSGIPDEIRSKIFDPFFTTKGVGEGTGLGLSIALGIVEEHGGQIHVHSVLGKGTRFTLTLPRKVVKASKEAMAA